MTAKKLLAAIIVGGAAVAAFSGGNVEREFLSLTQLSPELQEAVLNEPEFEIMRSGHLRESQAYESRLTLAKLSILQEIGQTPREAVAGGLTDADLNRLSKMLVTALDEGVNADLFGAMMTSGVEDFGFPGETISAASRIIQEQPWELTSPEVDFSSTVKPLSIESIDDQEFYNALFEAEEATKSLSSYFETKGSSTALDQSPYQNVDWDPAKQILRGSNPDRAKERIIRRCENRPENCVNIINKELDRMQRSAERAIPGIPDRVSIPTKNGRSISIKVPKF